MQTAGNRACYSETKEIEKSLMLTLIKKQKIMLNEKLLSRLNIHKLFYMIMKLEERIDIVLLK